MPVTISYELSTDNPNERNYIRSMFERFNWKRLGGSVLRYNGKTDQQTGEKIEDWLNDVVPSLMFFRSYVLAKDITVKFFTIDAASVSFVDHNDPTMVLGALPLDGAALNLTAPTNSQSAEGRLREFVTVSTDAAKQHA